MMGMESRRVNEALLRAFDELAVAPPWSVLRRVDYGQVVGMLVANVRHERVARRRRFRPCRARRDA